MSGESEVEADKGKREMFIYIMTSDFSDEKEVCQLLLPTPTKIRNER